MRVPGGNWSGNRNGGVGPLPRLTEDIDLTRVAQSKDLDARI